jgi:hypothetical protein
MRAWLKFARVAFGSAMGAGTLPVLALAAIVAVAGVSYSKGAQRQKQLCRTADVEAQVESQNTSLVRIQEQISAANKVRENSDTRAERDAAIQLTSREKSDAFLQELADRPLRCPISSDDAERLRQIGK